MKNERFFIVSYSKDDMFGTFAGRTENGEYFRLKDITEHLGSDDVAIVFITELSESDYNDFISGE